jgi:anthranilate synthase component 2
MGKILVLDNYDSFTYNLVHIVEKYANKEVVVFRNDEIDLEDVEQFDEIILSPGPGLPEEAGILKPLIKKYSPTKRIFGVCLGHQAIAEVFGAKLQNMEEVLHGVSTPVHVIEESDIFEGISGDISVARYHSWIVDKETMPDELLTTSDDINGEIMSLIHIKYDVRGVQFHPESILTPRGELMIKNFLEIGE